jgi:hypothetical protein
MNTPSEYALFEGGNLVATAHPEPKRDDPAADQLAREELLKMQRWTDDDLATASCCGFPVAKYQLWTRRGREVRWSRQDVSRWIERVKSLKIR